MTKTIDHKSRAHAVLSASSAARWLACPPSALASTAYSEQDTPFTREGTLAHEVAEMFAAVAVCHVPADNFQKTLDEVVPQNGYTPEMLECAQGYADYILEHIKSDKALVLLEERVDFSPWVPDGFGTADCIIIQDRTMIVMDYKYGKGVAVDAKGNSQERLYALGAFNDYGFAYDIDTVETHIYQPRIGNISVETMSASDLLAWGETVKPIAAQAAKGEGDYCPGSHCRFCPHAGRCRALTDTCRTFVNAHGMSVEVPVLAPHEIAEVLQMEPLVSLWLKRVKDQALSGMLNGDTVPGYKVVAGKPGNRKWINEHHAYQTLTMCGYAHDDITETKLLSPAGLEKAFGKKHVADLMASLTERTPGAPVIAPANDKRQDYNPANDFETLD